MNDCISREAAIEVIRKARDKSEMHRMLVQLPSAQPDVSDTNVGKMCEYYDLCRNGRDEKKLREELLSAQPECEDAVSRKAVEEMLQNGFPERGMWEVEGDIVRQTVCETLVDALMDLEKLPPVTPKQPGWIPTSERLPKNGYWLWSANGGEVKKDFYWDGHWELAEKYGYEVLAWMPLPKPWEGDANG